MRCGAAKRAASAEPARGERTAAAADPDAPRSNPRAATGPHPRRSTHVARDTDAPAAADSDTGHHRGSESHRGPGGGRASWSLVVKVFVEGGDVYENRLVWK